MLEEINGDPEKKSTLVRKKTDTTRRQPTRSKKSTKKSVKSGQYKHSMQIAERLKPYLKAFNEPTVSIYKEARMAISRLIFEDSPKKINELDELEFVASVMLSVRHLHGYATLDHSHIAQINSLIKTIESYIDDSSQQRPLNLLMIASPGAGKSHLIKCVAARLASRNVRAITFNMTNMQTNDDLVPPLDAARNLKVEDRVPLLFLDEFDSSPQNFALLLPLLWDGSLNLGQRDLRLGKVIIVMAGSDPSLPETMDHARSMRHDLPMGGGQNPKLIDLFSRVNGGVMFIPPFYDVAHNIDRRTDKVCIAIQLLINRFGGHLKKVPIALLRFIAMVEFRYDVRSIAHLVDIIPYKERTKELSLKQLALPLNSATRLKESSLAYHLLHEDQAYGIVEDWKKAVEDDSLIFIDYSLLRAMGTIPLSMLDRYLPIYLENI